MAQQTGGAVNARGVSDLPLGAAGAGVIQRMKIGDLDTDVPDQLKKLKDKVWAMETPGEVEAMRSDITERLGLNKPDRYVGSCLKPSTV